MKHWKAVTLWFAVLVCLLTLGAPLQAQTATHITNLTGQSGGVDSINRGLTVTNPPGAISQIFSTQLYMSIYYRKSAGAVVGAISVPIDADNTAPIIPANHTFFFAVAQVNVASVIMASRPSWLPDDWTYADYEYVNLYSCTWATGGGLVSAGGNYKLNNESFQYWRSP